MFPQVYLFLLLIIKCFSYQNSWNSEYNRYKTPQDVMVDVVNNLALKLLAIHSDGNDNNVAISPYGALTVLVALKEGVRGSAAAEIYRATGIPSDLSTIRIGLRDIHRHLKSYFIPEEGFLSGLTLSHDNVTLNREYEDILRFYGFDIDGFNNAVYTTTENILSTTENLSTTTEKISEKEENGDLTSTTDASTTTEGRTTRSETLTTLLESLSTTAMSQETTTSVVETTTSGEVGTTTATPTTLKLEATTTEREKISTTEVSTEPTTTSRLSTEGLNSEPTELSTTTEGTKSTAESEPTTEISTTTEGTKSTAESELSTEGTKSTIEISTTTESLTTTTEVDRMTSSIISTTETASTMFSTSEMSTLEAADSTVGTTESILPDSTTTTAPNNESEINDTRRRDTRSVVDYIIARYYDDHAITQRPPPFNSENDLYFFVNGKYKETNISYMTYDTVLPFHYVSHLNTLALRFPLDSSKYYLLLLLPENHHQINKLICDLRLNSNLNYIIDNLRYTHVKAIIPSFMLKGYVVLTPTFQKMGINRVFEPRQADFSPMTSDRGIYVTNIEQAITVNIRNYVDPSTMNNRYVHRTTPVLFKADHPFLYFVIDSEIGVTLMAGKIINPLNSRIR